MDGNPGSGGDATTRPAISVNHRLAAGEVAAAGSGMVKHLALADEHYWFRCVVGGEPWGEWGKRFTSLRIVMLHVLKETACHAGHLDAASELLDGRQWIVLGDR